MPFTFLQTSATFALKGQSVGLVILWDRPEASINANLIEL
jgi:hypothetical protein